MCVKYMFVCIYVYMYYTEKIWGWFYFLLYTFPPNLLTINIETGKTFLFLLKASTAS